MHDILSTIWQYRQLLFFLMMRDVKVRYKQAFFGIAWAVLTPLTQTGVFVLVFGIFLNVNSGSTPYLLTTFTGLVFWNFFAQSVSSSAASLTGNTHLVKKAAFPKEILVFSSILGRTPDLLVSFVVLVLLLFVYNIGISYHFFWILILFVIEIVLAGGIGMLFAVGNVYFRDINVLLPLLLSAWIFLTPVVYTLSSIPQKYQLYASLNPMTGIIEGIKSVLLLHQVPDLTLLGISVLYSLGIFSVSYILFKRMEGTFADVI